MATFQRARSSCSLAFQRPFLSLFVSPTQVGQWSAVGVRRDMASRRTNSGAKALHLILEESNLLEYEHSCWKKASYWVRVSVGICACRVAATTRPQSPVHLVANCRTFWHGMPASSIQA